MAARKSTAKKATKPARPRTALRSSGTSGTSTVVAVSRATDHPIDNLYGRVAEILEQARSNVARTVNVSMINAYWLIGHDIVEVEQAGAARAGHGERVLEG